MPKEPNPYACTPEQLASLPPDDEVEDLPPDELPDPVFGEVLVPFSACRGGRR